MQWEVIVALAIGIPVILFPAAYVWYINIGGLVALVKQARERRAARARKPGLETLAQEQEYENALTEALKKYPW